MQHINPDSFVDFYTVELNSAGLHLPAEFFCQVLSDATQTHKRHIKSVNMSCDCRTSERAALWTKECEGQRSIRQLWCLPGRDPRCLSWLQRDLALCPAARGSAFGVLNVCSCEAISERERKQNKICIAHFINVFKQAALFFLFCFTKRSNPMQMTWGEKTTCTMDTCWIPVWALI